MLINNMLQVINAWNLKRNVISTLKKQGYVVTSKGFLLKDKDRETKRSVHSMAKNEKLFKKKDFIHKNTKFIEKYLLNGKDIDVTKIKPKLHLVESGTKLETIFKWWNIVWWSLPYERAYGRQMRYVIWDEYHQAPIGLIGLQSPILSWKVRDDYLGINIKQRDFWVNQSLSAQRLGALPPYNYFLGGKLVGSLMTTEKVRKDFEEKYKDTVTLMEKRILPARLLFITTTGAYGKSSVYTRLKFGDEHIAKFIGYSQGHGSFHIPDALFDELIKYLETKNFNVKRGFGSGPSRKLRLIDNALQSLGIMNGAMHGVQRAVYLFPFVANLHEVIKNNAEPVWIDREVDAVTDYWKKRWALPRIEKNKEYLDFDREDFLEQTMISLGIYDKIGSAS